MRIGRLNYIEKRVCGRSGKSDVGENWRNWWLARFGMMTFKFKIPQRLEGKRFRLKIEVIEPAEKKDWDNMGR